MGAWCPPGLVLLSPGREEAGRAAAERGAQPPHPQAPRPLPAGPARRRRRRRSRGKALQCCCSVSKAMRHDGCSSRRGHRAALKPRSGGRAAAPSPSPPSSPRWDPLRSPSPAAGVLRGQPCCLWGQSRPGAFLKCSHTWGRAGCSRSLAIRPGDVEGTFNSLTQLLLLPAGARPGVTSPVQEKHRCLVRAMPPPLQGAVGTRGCHHPVPGGCSQRAATSPRRPACFPS